MKSHNLKIHGGILLIFSLIVSGCSPVRMLSSRADQDFILGNYQSYRFYDIALDTIDVPEFYQRLGWIEEEMRTQFSNRGLSYSKEDPDLLVNIGLVFEEKTQMRETDIVTDAPKYIGNMNYSWQSEMVEMGKYSEGTMVMHLVDARSKVLVWEGILQSVVVKNDEQARKNIHKGIGMLFDRLE
jgi:hypothetical protein